MTQRDFDNLMRQKLEGLHPGVPEGAWDQFATHWEGQETDSPEAQELDEALRSKLAALPPPVMPKECWEMMEERLDEAALPNAAASFDALFANSLLRQEPVQKTGHWEKMQQRLEEERKLRMRILRTKMAEAALFLLFLYTVINLWKDPTVVLEGIRSGGATPGMIAQQETVNEATAAFPVSPGAEQAAIAVTIPDAVNAEAGNALAGQKTLPANAYRKALRAGNYHDASEKVQPAMAGAVAIPGASRQAQVLSALDRAASQTIALPTFELGGMNAMNTALAGHLPMRMLVNKAIECFPGTEPLDQLPSLKPSPKTKDFKFSVAVMGKGERVVSLSKPRFPDFAQVRRSDEPAGPRPGWGYGAGIITSFGWKGVSLDAGLIYATLTYEGPDAQSRKLIINKGSFQNGWEGDYRESIQLNTIQIPVHLRTKLAQSGKTKLSLITGASLSLVAEAGYNIISIRVGESRADANAVEFVKSKSPFDGLMEGGDFESNHSISLDAGVSLERAIIANLSFFIQPLVQYQITGRIGPDEDVLRVFSVQAGLRKEL